MPHTVRRLIILSPHLDDGILSCGGLISALCFRYRVEVWTLFCRAPWMGPYSGTAQWLHSVSGGKTGSRLARARRKEDLKACGMLGAHSKHFSWQDAVYRRGLDKQFLYQDCRQDSWKRDDEPTIREIMKILHKNLKADDCVLVPMGIGRHVDHLIVKHAAQQTEHPGLAYYQDIPYAQRFPEEMETMSEGMIGLDFGISELQAVEWVKAVRAYQTQIRMLEDEVGSLEAVIMEYVAFKRLSLFAMDHSKSILAAMANDLKSVCLDFTMRS